MAAPTRLTQDQAHAIAEALGATPDGLAAVDQTHAALRDLAAMIDLLPPRAKRKLTRMARKQRRIDANHG